MATRGPKLTPRSVKRIRALLAAGVSQRKIAKRYKISQPMVHHIHSGRCWPMPKQAS